MVFEQIQLFDGGGTQTVSVREFADLVGVHESTIRNKYIKTGKITGAAIVPKGASYCLNLEAALAQWRTFHPEQDAASEEKPAGSMTEMQAASLRRALATAEREELELSILKGTHIHTDDIRDTFGPMISSAKHKLYQLEDLLVARLPGNPVENGRVIRQVIDEICSELQYVEPKPKKRRGHKAAITAQAQ